MDNYTARNKSVNLLLQEMIQNAEDAGADVCNFIYDENTHLQHMLPHMEMRQIQVRLYHV